MKAFADDKLNVDKMTISLYDRVESTVGKEENAGYQHFLLFPQCFPKPSSLGSLKSQDCVVENPEPNDKILAWSKWKGFADDKIYVNENLKFILWKGGKPCGKRRKCWLPAFYPFPIMFLNGSFFRVIKSQYCVVKSL